MLPPWFPSPASRPDSVTKVVLLPPVTEAELSLQPPRPRPRDLECERDLLAPGLLGAVTGLLDSSTEDSESNSSELRSAPFCLKMIPATNQSIALQRQSESEFNRYLTMSKLPT